MRIAQQRTPAGCAFAVAAGWLAWSFAVQRVDLIDYVFVGSLVAFGIFLFVYRKIYPNAVLVTDELPQPGNTFRGRVETPLSSEPAEVRTQLMLSRRRGRYGRVLWQSGEQIVRGATFDVAFPIPSEVGSQIDAWCNWSLSVRQGFFRASFSMKAANFAQSPAASA